MCCPLVSLAKKLKVGGNRVRALRHPARFLSIVALVLSAALLGNAGPAAAANPLLCFDGPSDGSIYGGNCTINAGGTGARATTPTAIPTEVTPACTSPCRASALSSFRT